VARDIQECGRVGRSVSDQVEQTGALRGDKSAVLLNQGGVPEGKHCRIIPEGPDGSVDVTLLHRCQVAEPRKEPRVLKWAPGGSNPGCNRRLDRRGDSRRVLQDYSIQEVSVGEWRWGKGGTAALGLLTEGDPGLERDSNLAKKAHVDNFHSFRRGDDLRALSGEGHGSL